MISPQSRLQDAQALIGKMEPEAISQALEEAMKQGVSLKKQVLRTRVQVRSEAPFGRFPELDAAWE